MNNFKVKCLNNIGMENRFVVDNEYDAKLHDDNDLLYVWDNNGDLNECMKERFEILEQEKFDKQNKEKTEDKIESHVNNLNQKMLQDLIEQTQKESLKGNK